MTANTTEQPKLVERMRARAEQMREGRIADQLRHHAGELEKAIAGFYASPQTVSVRPFLAAYARARLYWHTLTGEPLI